MPEDYARMLSAMDTSIKFGAEDRTNDAVFVITGSAPKKFRDFAQSVKDVWETRSKFESAGGQMQPE
jgi:festuclavine dehydrogenase